MPFLGADNAMTAEIRIGIPELERVPPTGSIPQGYCGEEADQNWCRPDVNCISRDHPWQYTGSS